MDWRDWTRAVIKLPVEWNGFYVTNAVVIVLGIVQAHLSATLPGATLSYAALVLIHRGRFSPGLIAAIVLFYPVALGCYWRAASAGLFTLGTVTGSVVAGAVIMSFPIVLLKLKGKPCFRQS